MLERNMAVKLAPERFQGTPHPPPSDLTDSTKQFDVIIAFEERVFDIIAECKSAILLIVKS
jgi:hypothetical protein